jgi:hypothetical protein
VAQRALARLAVLALGLRRAAGLLAWLRPGLRLRAARIDRHALPARDEQLRAAHHLAADLAGHRVGLGRAGRDRLGRPVAPDLRRPRAHDGGEVVHAQHVGPGRGLVAGEDDLLGRARVVARGAHGGQRAVRVLAEDLDVVVLWRVPADDDLDRAGLILGRDRELPVLRAAGRLVVRAGAATGERVLARGGLVEFLDHGAAAHERPGRLVDVPRERAGCGHDGGRVQ